MKIGPILTPAFILAALLLNGCVSGGVLPDESDTQAASENAVSVDPSPEAIDPPLEEKAMPSEAQANPANNSLADQAIADLAERMGYAPEEIEIMRFENVTWRNGSLGCPLPGMMYTQALVDGSLIELSAGGKIYSYHSGGGRPPFLCESPDKQEPAPGDDGSYGDN
jgi:hypothetical protein